MTVERLRLSGLVSLLFICVFVINYGGQLHNWTHQLPGSGEDGAKNYYTIAYHVEHGTSFAHFAGMNAPYGEHVLYTDNQPLVSNSLRLLNKILPISEMLPWLLPWLIVLSYMLGAYFLAISLKSLGVSFWLSAAGAVGIMFLSPQWLRLSGHYSLAYGVVIPMCIWLLTQYAKSDRKKWLIYLTAAIVLSGFIHPYFLVMSALGSGLIVMAIELNSSTLTSFKPYLTSGVILLFPVILFQLIMMVTDNVNDRPDTPYGYLNYKATLSSVFLPLDLAYGGFLHSLFPNTFKPSAEGPFYLGLATVAGLIGTTALTLKSIWSKRSMQNLPLGPSFKWMLFASPILVLSVGLPFVLEPFESWLEHMGPLRQFRGIGRFSFVFYYTAGILTIVWIQRLFKASGITRFGAMALIAILYFEGYQFSRFVSDRTSSGTKEFANLSFAQDEYAKYDAIATIPYFHIGSENFRTPHADFIKGQAFKLSLESGLPLTSVQMSRSSLQQTVKQLQLTHELIQSPAILNDSYPEHLLLMVEDGDLSVEEEHLVHRASLRSSHDGYKLYELNSTAFADVLNSNVALLREQASASRLLSNDTSVVKHLSFDNTETGQSFHGAGALRAFRNEWTSIVSKQDAPYLTEVSEVSFWFYIGGQNRGNTQVWFEEKNNSESVRFELSEVCDHFDAIVDDWALVTLNLTKTSEENYFEINLHRDGPEVEIWIDELLIRPSSLSVTKTGNRDVNNRFFEP